MAQRSPGVTIASMPLARRAMLRALAGSMLAGGATAAVTAAATDATPVPAAESAPLAEIVVAALPSGPLEVHIAHVIVPAGVSLPAATPSGVRLLAVEAGTLAVELTASSPGALLARVAPPGRRLVAPKGGAIALEAAAIAGVGSAGPKPAVFLDAAVFLAGARPPERAFTTIEGVGFQVFAGGEAGPPPEGACAVALARTTIPPGTESIISGMALLFSRAGSGWVFHDAGDVRYARAAAPAPGSTAGPWRAVEPDRPAPLTAGSAILLGRADRARVGNDGNRPLRALLLTIRPALHAAER
jgi:hypothetical protein